MKTYLTMTNLGRSALYTGAVLLLGVMSEKSALGAERRRAARVESPGVGAPGVGATARPGVGAPGAGVTAGAAGVGAGAPGAGVTAGAPGVGAGARGAGVAPGVGVGSPGAGVLPKGYLATIPAGWKTFYYGGYYCAYVSGVYYRPVYYQGVIVYVVVP